MPAAYRSHSTATSSSTSFSISRPSGTTEGDILVLCQAGLTSLSSMTTPSGWTQIAAEEGAGEGNLFAKVCVKAATSSEPSSYSLAQGSFGESVAHIFCVSGGVLPAVVATSTSGSGTNVTTPGITPTGASDLEIRFAAGNGQGSSRTWTPPAGLTEPSGADANSAGWTTLGGAYRQLMSTAPTSALNFTVSGSIVARLGFTVAIASPAPPVTPKPIIRSGAVVRASYW